MLQSYSVHENLETFRLGCGKKKCTLTIIGEF